MCSRFSFGGIARFGYVLISFVALMVAGAHASDASSSTSSSSVEAVVPKAAQAAITSYGNTFRIDPSFATMFESNSDWMTISAVVASPDGGFFVGGDFSTIGGQLHLGLAKYKADGTVDPNFNPNGGFDGAVDCISVQQDGRILVAGMFTSFNGTARAGFARLNVDGTLDVTFNPASEFSSPSKIVVQADGRILVTPRVLSGASWDIAVTSTAVSGISVLTSSNASNLDKGFARLNADGSVDSTFNLPGTGFDLPVNCLAVQTDGRILVGGVFTTFNGVSRNQIARLNADGSLDMSFIPDSGFAAVTSIAVKVDGKIYACAYSLPSSVTANIVSLNANGTIDATFTSPPSFAFSPETFALQPNGKIIVGGGFNNFADPAPPNTARLNADGSLDPSYTPSSVGYLNIRSLALQADGRIVVGGQNTFSNSSSAASLFRLTGTGVLDDTLATGNSRRPTRQIEAIPLTGGKFLVHGDFKWVNGTSCGSFVRLNADGALDSTFNAGTGFDNTGYRPGGGFIDPVACVALQVDGKYLVGGSFTTFNSTACNYLVRMNTNGTLDTAFRPSLELDGSVASIALQADRRIVVGGGMSGGIARLNTDGVLDPTFQRNVGLAETGYYLSLVVLSVQIAPADGRILVGGSFAYNNPRNGINTLCIARLNTDGTIDATFDTGTGFLFIDTFTYVKSLILQADGRILAGGYFSSFNGTPRNVWARLNANGSLDTSFTPNLGTNGYFSANFDFTPVVQTDGRMVVGDSAQIGGILRLNADGSVDSGFSIHDYNGNATSAKFTDDGRLLLSGGMAFGGGAKQIGLVLLKPDGSSSSSSSSSGSSSSSSSGGLGGPSSSGAGGPNDWFVFTAIALLVHGRRRFARNGVSPMARVI